MFVGSQVRLILEEDYFYQNLVFYNRFKNWESYTSRYWTNANVCKIL